MGMKIVKAQYITGPCRGAAKGGAGGAAAPPDFGRSEGAL